MNLTQKLEQAVDEYNKFAEQHAKNEQSLLQRQGAIQALNELVKEQKDAVEESDSPE